MLISYVSTKGGVGKTTISVHHAHWLHLAGLKVGFVDADQQTASSRWLKRIEPKIQVRVALTPKDIQNAVKQLEKENEVVVADAPGGTNKQCILLIRHSRICLVPMNVSPLDVYSTYSDTRQLLDFVKSHYGVAPDVRAIINGLDMRTKFSRQILKSSGKMKPRPIGRAVPRSTVLATVADVENPDSVFNLKSNLARNCLDSVFSEVSAIVDGGKKEVAANG